MGRRSWGVWMVLWAALAVFTKMGGCSPTPKNDNGLLMHSTKPKLIYIMLDGFRWDYVQMYRKRDLPGFTKFLKEGVQAEWTIPIYPSLSYPTWTTLVTGQYAETHGVVGNYFYDAETKEMFSIFDAESTGKEKWWTSEPIWTTAEKAGLKTAQYKWARCDVPINGFKTQYCEHFVKSAPGKEIFLNNIMNALEKIDRHGYNFVQVFTDHCDNAGHIYGPDSDEVRQTVLDLDDVISILMSEIEDRGLTDYVNIVIVSDHGMAYTAPGAIQRHEVDFYINTSLVENIADRGALMNIKLPPENVDQFQKLLSRIQGVKAYKKEDIPEELHYKHGKYVHEIVLMAEEGNFLMASKSKKQHPPHNDFVYVGDHGYGPDVKNMWGIFYAKGPAFRHGLVIEPIQVVDVYQVLTNILQLTPNPHNGTWNSVKLAFKPNHRKPKPSVASGTPKSLAASVILILIPVSIARFIE